MSIQPRPVALLMTLALAVACGGSIDKPKKGNTSNNTANNTTANNTANNTTSNNTTANNTTSNNTTAPCVSVEPASVNFGSVQVGEVGTASVLVANCSSVESLVLESASASAGFDAMLPATTELPPNTSVAIMAEFAPVAPVEYGGQLSIGTSAGAAVVTLTGVGLDEVEPSCPTAVAAGRVGATGQFVMNVAAVEGDTVQLSASLSLSDEPILAYEWAVVTRPGGSTAVLTPSATVMEPSLFLDAMGTYEVDLRLVTANSPETCPAARMTIDAAPGEDPEAIVLTLTWQTPGDTNQTDSTGSDLDLHYKLPTGVWNTAPGACYWGNKTAAWGADGTATMDLDDLNGLGPEIITHRNAGTNAYAIGVHYFGDNAFGASDAKVQLHIGGVLQFERTKAGLLDNQFWYVGDYSTALSSLVVNDTVTLDFPP